MIEMTAFPLRGGRPAWSTAVGLGPIPYRFAGSNPAPRTTIYRKTDGNISMHRLCSVKLVEHSLFIYENMSLCTTMLTRGYDYCPPYGAKSVNRDIALDRGIGHSRGGYLDSWLRHGYALGSLGKAI